MIFLLKIDKSAYVKYAGRHAKRSPLLIDCVKAFVSGGAICAFGQWLTGFFMRFVDSIDDARMITCISLIFIAALATGFGFFDKIAKHAGAGTLVPITGFANSVVSPAIDNKAEGFVTGLGAKIFIVAGPVILYGTLASVIYGIVLWVIGVIL